MADSTFILSFRYVVCIVYDVASLPSFPQNAVCFTNIRQHLHIHPFVFLSLCLLICHCIRASPDISVQQRKYGFLTQNVHYALTNYQTVLISAATLLKQLCLDNSIVSSWHKSIQLQGSGLPSNWNKHSSHDVWS